MSAGLAALGDQRTGAHPLHKLGHRAGGNHRDDFDAGGEPVFDVLGGVAGTGGDNCNLFLQNHLGHLICKGAEQHDVDAKRLVRQRFRNANLLADIVAIGVAGGDDAQTAAVGNRCGQPAVGNPRHTALKDRIGDANQITNWSM